MIDSTETLYLVANDTGTQISATITRSDTDLPQDLTECTSITLHFRRKGSATIIESITGVVTDAANGIVAFPMTTALVGLTAGNYEGEIEVVFVSGSLIETIYEVLKFKVRSDF